MRKASITRTMKLAFSGVEDAMFWLLRIQMESKVLTELAKQNLEVMKIHGSTKSKWKFLFQEELPASQPDSRTSQNYK